MRELRGLERGQVSIGVNESSIHALLPALARYRQLHPAIHIRVHRVFSRDVPREVLSHHLDFGVISYIPEENELTAGRILSRFADGGGLAGPPVGETARGGHCANSARKHSLRTSWSPHYRQRVVQMFARHHVPLQMDIEMPTIESIKLFVEMKMGVAIVPHMCVGTEIEHGLLKELRMRQMRMQRRLYLVYRQDRPLTAAAQALVDMLRGKPSKGRSRHGGHHFVKTK